MKKYIISLFSAFFLLSSCGDSNPDRSSGEDNPHKVNVSEKTIQSVENFQKRARLLSETKKELTEILNENIDLEELNEVTEADP